jgi:hypothetical protein
VQEIACYGRYTADHGLLAFACARSCKAFLDDITPTVYERGRYLGSAHVDTDCELRCLEFSHLSILRPVSRRPILATAVASVRVP